MAAIEPLRVGDVLHGYCGGYFGRDSYDDKRVEAVGADWVVARTHSGGVVFAGAAPNELTVFRDSVDADHDCSWPERTPIPTVEEK